LLFYYTIVKEPSRDLEKKFADWAQEIQKIKDNKSLNEFIKNRFQSEIIVRQNTFEINFGNLLFSNMQKFKLRYILAKFSNFIEKERVDGAESSLEEYFKSDVHIEHILPDERNQKMLKAKFKGNTREYDLYKEKIGNLTFLEKPLNISIKNKDYKDKKSVYKKSKFYLTRSIVEKDQIGKQTSVIRVDKLLKTFDEWDKETITSRGELFLKLSSKIWKIDSI